MNPLLSKAREAILAKVNPKLMPVVAKLEEAGKKVMYSAQTQHMMLAQLKGAPPDQMDETVGAGIAKLVGILFTESKRTAPMQALIPAGMVLLFDGLDFLEEAGAVQVTPQFLADSTRAAGAAIAQMFGATPDKLSQLSAQQQGAAPAAPDGAPAAPPAPGGIVGSAIQPAGGA